MLSTSISGPRLPHMSEVVTDALKLRNECKCQARCDKRGGIYALIWFDRMLKVGPLLTISR